MADENADSGDYTRFGIPDAPRATVTTPFGKTKTCAGLLQRERLFLLLSLINILTACSLTIYRLVVVVEDDPKNSDFTFTILILVNAVFVAFYALHGVFRERKYELYVQVLAVLIIVIYCIVEYSVNHKRRTTVKLVRLIIAAVIAPPNIILAVLVARNFGELEFRIAGASQHLQYIYNQAAIFSCWLKFDLQITEELRSQAIMDVRPSIQIEKKTTIYDCLHRVSLVVLVLRYGTDVSSLETVTLAVGIPYTILWVILGWLTLRLEMKWGVFVFFILGLAKPAYYIFKFVKLYHDVDEYDQIKQILYCVIIAGALAILCWVVLMVELIYIYKNFGQGLKDTGKISFGIFTIGEGNFVRQRPVI